MRPKKLVKGQLGGSWKLREQTPPAVDTAVANRGTSGTTKFTTNMKHALTVENKAMAKIPQPKQERMNAPHMVRPVPTVVGPTTSRLPAAARPSQTPNSLPHQMPLLEKLRMLSLMPSALPLVSARPKTDV